MRRAVVGLMAVGMLAAACVVVSDPVVPTGVTAAADGSGIRISWNNQPGVEVNINRNNRAGNAALGYHDTPQFTVANGVASYVDTKNVTSGTTYRYTVVGFNRDEAGHGQNFTSQSAVVTATAGDGGPGPGEVECNGSDAYRDRFRPSRVGFGSGSERTVLKWEMEAEISAGMNYQSKRNGSPHSVAYPTANWDQISNLRTLPSFSETVVGNTRRLQVDLAGTGIRPGDSVKVEAFRTRYCPSGRSATLQNPASFRPRVATSFKDSFGSSPGAGASSSVGDPWLGSYSNWNFNSAQFSDEFNGSLDQWYFAKEDRVFPSNDRNQTIDSNHAVPTTVPSASGNRSVLKMSVDKDTGAYSYLGSDQKDHNGYVVDPTKGVFIEASVRMDEAAPATNAWWAFWLMAPDGNDPYDDNINTGSEVDIFELVPDQNNGFNSAIFKDQLSSPNQGCNAPANANDVYQAQRSLNPSNYGCFTYATSSLIPGLVSNYMDGNFHRIGMYYSPDRMAFYIDDTRIWTITDRAWITANAELSLRLTWEVQDNSNPWNSHLGGSFSETPRATDPTVYIDWVNVWSKR